MPVCSRQKPSLAQESWGKSGEVPEGVSPKCIGPSDPDVEEAIEEALTQGDGWAVIDDDSLGPHEVASADCTQMVLSVGGTPAVSWTYRIGSEPARTVAVPLAELGRQVGSPLGDPLKDIP